MKTWPLPWTALALIAGWLAGFLPLTSPAQNVGIGTNNPEYKLQVGAHSSGTALGIAGNNGNTQSSELLFSDGSFGSGMGLRYDSDNNSLYVDDNYDGTDGSLAREALFTIQRPDGNVGIGTTSPSRTLDVAGDVEMNNRDIYNINETYTDQLRDGGGGNFFTGSGGSSQTVTGITADGQLQFSSISIGESNVSGVITDVQAGNDINVSGGNSGDQTVALENDIDLNRARTDDIRANNNANVHFEDNIDLEGRSVYNANEIESQGGAKQPHLVLNSTSNGGNWSDQGAYISIGESGALGGATMHMTYRGDGYGFIGSGPVSSAEPGASYLRFDYNRDQVYTPDKVSIGGGLRLNFGGASAGDLLKSTNGDGDATWVNPDNLNDDDWNRNGTNLHPSNSGDHVGIGTSSPATELEVQSDAPVLRLDDTNGGGGRPGIQFFGNNLHVFESDDNANETFGFYSNFDDERDNRAELRVFGPVSGTFNKNYVQLTHTGGSDGYGQVSTDAGHLALQPDQNVGVATSDPERKLQVGSHSSSTAIGIAGNNGNTQSSELLFSDGSFGSGMGLRYDSDNNKLYIDDNYDGSDGSLARESLVTIKRKDGNVGIGTTSPEDELHISGGDFRLDDAYYNRIRVVSDNYWAGMEIRTLEKSTNGNPHIDLSHGSSGSPNFGIRLFAPDNNSFAIQGGNVGIGATSPTNTLDVGGEIRIRGGNPDNGDVLTSTNGSGDATWSDPASIGGDNDWQTGSGNAYRTSGNVGVGTNSPVAAVHVTNGNRETDPSVDGTQIADGEIELANSGFSKPYIDFTHDPDGSTDYDGRIIYKASGTSVGADVIEMKKCDFNLTSGNAYKSGGGNWQSNSDRRVKKDIEAYQAGLQEVLQIQPKWYRYNELAPTNSQERFVGVIAQEIKDVAPYMVEKKPLPGLSAKQARKFEKNEKGVPMHYVYDGSAMQYMLVNATQEQQQQIKTLRQANRQLRQDIQQLRQTVQQLQKHVRAE